jgi:transposase-like protein
MTNYSESFKESLVKKALLQPDRSPRLFAKEAGISNSALYNWIKRYKISNGISEVANNCCDNSIF